MKLPHHHSYANALGVPVDAIDMERALAQVSILLRSHRKGYVCVAGVHGVMEAQRSSELFQVYREAAMTIPDGMPLVWVGRLQGNRDMRRVTGPDITLEIFRRTEFANVRHFFYGGEEGVAQELTATLQARFPWTNIVGSYTPPFRELSSEEHAELVSSIAKLKPDIIWVGIGCPKQEIFMRRNLPLLETKLMIGVGAAFDYHTGRILDSPEWMKHAGLQWLHRLKQEPRRLWKRYLKNNPSFLWRIAVQLLGFRKYELGAASPGKQLPPWEQGCVRRDVVGSD